ncbi:MAG: GNAT family N-acetyltransferase [Bradyrhizobium sp.]|nr:GNAT family N-acetyltransferase [Bradyrhizobium sp.]
MATIEIVPITQGHIEGFHRTLDIVARERRYLAFLEAPPLEATRAFILDIIEQGYPQFVALSAGEVVGWCDVTPKQPIYAHNGVLGMGLLPQFRRRGIGKRLIAQALGAAQAFGLQRVELTVRENNVNAIALYKKVGFEIEGVQREAILVDGVHENLILMGLLF